MANIYGEDKNEVGHSPGGGVLKVDHGMRLQKTAPSSPNFLPSKCKRGIVQDSGWILGWREAPK